MRTEDANRERLVQFLRDEDAQKRHKFHWNFGICNWVGSCGTAGCAIGAAVVLGLIKVRHPVIVNSAATELSKAIGLQSPAIFLEPEEYGLRGRAFEHVTAAMVADKIEEVAREGYGG